MKFLAHVQRSVETHIGAPCELQLSERDLLRAVLMRRSIPQVELHANGVPLGDTGARIATLQVRLDNVMLRGPRRHPEVTASGGRFVATFLDDAIEHLVDLPPVIERVWLMEDGVRVNMVAGVAVTCDLRLEESQIVLRPRLSERLDRRLPWNRLGQDLLDLPFGARIETLNVTDSQLVTAGSLDSDFLRWSVGSPHSARTTSPN
jgi:hypothetical protein